MPAPIDANELADALDSVRERFTVAKAIGGTACWNATGSAACALILKEAAKFIRQGAGAAAIETVACTITEETAQQIRAVLLGERS